MAGAMGETNSVFDWFSDVMPHFTINDDMTRNCIQIRLQ